MAAMAVGFAISTAHTVGMAIAIVMPALVLTQGTRKKTYVTALAYYGAAIWAIMPGARNFFGPNVSALSAAALWAAAIALLALPWALLWSPNRTQLIWRGPLALAITIVPPLGIIGWVSPLTGAGYLFPGTGWWGIVACVITAGSIAVFTRTTVVAVAAISIITNLTHPHDPIPPPGWLAISTNFGDIAHTVPSPNNEFRIAEAIQRKVLSTNSSVIVFPETIVPYWTEATDDSWRETIQTLRATGKTILVGARVPRTNSSKNKVDQLDFAEPLAVLDRATTLRTLRHPARQSEAPYDNSIIVRGVQEAMFRQRIPVPIAMWNPLTGKGAPLNLSGSAVMQIANQRAAILICYEHLLVWPVLHSMTKSPSIIVAVANDHWATGTPIPRFQLAATRAWARLFSLPYLWAANE